MTTTPIYFEGIDDTYHPNQEDLEALEQVRQERQETEEEEENILTQDEIDSEIFDLLYKYLTKEKK